MQIYPALLPVHRLEGCQLTTVRHLTCKDMHHNM